MPVIVVAPGFWVSVQVPVAGSPDKETLPVGRSQVGWTMVPTTGAAGVAGAALTVIFADGDDMHPVVLVTV